MIRNKARLVAQGYTKEEGIYYNEVFSHVARIKAITLFLAYASFKDFVVYEIYVKSAFLYGKIEEEVYICQPPGFEDPNFPDRVYKVKKALYELHQAPRAWFTEVETAITPMKIQNPLLKNEDGKDADVHMYRVGLTAKVESSNDEEDLGEDASKQRMISDIDVDDYITLISSYNDADNEMFNVDALDAEEVFVTEQEVTDKEVNDEFNVVEEVVQVINTTKKIINAAQYKQWLPVVSSYPKNHPHAVTEILTDAWSMGFQEVAVYIKPLL
nr:putative ribonuclease H-like domain-containing protein [Tanacetum cinerariifolium]